VGNIRIGQVGLFPVSKLSWKSLSSWSNLQQEDFHLSCTSLK